MCKIMEEMRRETESKAIHESSVKFALKLLKDGKYSFEKIAEFSELLIEEVKKLAVENGYVAK